MLTPPTSSQEAPSPLALPKDSARFRLSVVLLASALNAVVLVGVIGALVAHLNDLPGEGSTDGIVRFLPLIMALAMIVAVGVVASALQLRQVLSVPLLRLSVAARRLAEGGLDEPVGEIGGAQEFEHLGRALERMRQDLQEAMTEAQRSNERSRTMLGALGDGVIFLDDKLRALEYNPQAAVLLDGLPSVGALLHQGVSLKAVFPELPEQLFRAALNEETALPLSIFPRSDRARHLSLRVFPARNRALGVRRAYIAVLRDVSEAMEIAQVKEDFLSTVTHELKTPLTSIDGFVLLLLAERLGPLADKQRVALETVRDQSGALRRLVQDLLDATRLDRDELPLELEDVAIGPLAAEVAEAMRPSVEARGQRLELDLTALHGLSARVDPFRLRQVLGNLLSNAQKFTPEGGLIRVEGRPREGQLELSVADTGRGIPPEAVPRLFRKFSQVERGDTRRAGGAGLGLWIAQQLMVRMGGAMAVESEPGLGSRFTLSLPMRTPQE